MARPCLQEKLTPILTKMCWISKVYPSPFPHKHFECEMLNTQVPLIGLLNPSADLCLAATFADDSAVSSSL
jgi:hypothetical protein